MQLKLPLWIFIGGLIAVAIGLTLFLTGAQSTINDPSQKPQLTTTEVVGSVLMYVGSSISGLGLIWLIIAIIANAARGKK